MVKVTDETKYTKWSMKQSDHVMKCKADKTVQANELSSQNEIKVSLWQIYSQTYLLCMKAIYKVRAVSGYCLLTNVKNVLVRTARKWELPASTKSDVLIVPWLCTFYERTVFYSDCLWWPKWMKEYTKTVQLKWTYECKPLHKHQETPSIQM
jgi:hypothetical protein